VQKIGIGNLEIVSAVYKERHNPAISALMMPFALLREEFCPLHFPTVAGVAQPRLPY